jgi:hypothetical protein
MFLLLLIVFASLVSASEERAVWLDVPVSVADDRALRLDVQTASILTRARITKLVVCSAVDKPLVAYDATNPDTTGCSSAGFSATQVFPSLVREGPEKRVPDLFRVRQRARSTFIKRRLLDPHSPTVWIQATIELRDEHGKVIEPAQRVDMVRFQVPERVLAIGATLPPAAKPSQAASIIDSLLRFAHLRGDAAAEETGHDLDEAFRDYDELDGREDSSNGTSTRFYHHVHWSSYTAIIFGGLFGVVLIVFATVRWVRSGGGGGGSGALGRRRRRKSKDRLSDTEVDDLEAGRLKQIREWSAHARDSGLYYSEAGF